MLFSDIREIKRVLDIDVGDASEDVKLGFFNEWAAGWFEELLDRDFTYKSRVRVYSGTGTQKLLLKHRPVYPAPPSPFSAISVIFDENGFFGSGTGAFGTSATAQTLVYGTDFCLDIDKDDGSSRSGILYRINELWFKPYVRQVGLLSPFVGNDTGSFQITYTAGHSVDTLPSQLRMAANLLVARLRSLFPVGMEVSSESYQERSIGLVAERDDYVLHIVKPMVMNFRNWRF